MPKYGLAIPCKNGARFLPRLFASVRAQIRPFDELWLFDDGSDDDSSEVARQFGAQVLRTEKSLGPSAGRNRLIHACNCDWLHFHDADDTMDPHYLARVSARIRDDVDLVVCDMPWVHEETGKVENHWTYDSALFARNPLSYLLWNTIGGINGFYRRQALLDIGGFDETLHYWEDMELNLRLARRGHRVEVVNEDLVTAYRRGASHSNSNLGEVWRVKLQIMDRLRSSADPVLLKTIANESETIAERLACLRLWDDVPLALKLARRAGGNPPTTNSRLLRTLKIILPETWTFRLQHQLRKSQAS